MNNKTGLTLKQLDQLLIDNISHHEDTIPYAYQDIYGYWTIGTGRLIDKRKGGGLSPEECAYLLNNDIKLARKELSQFDWYTIQDEVRKGVLIELHFNMGLGNLLGFKKMISALKKRDYKKASAELLNSKWAKEDVGAERVANVRKRLETGAYN